MSREKQIIEIKECIDSVYGADCAYFDVDGFAISNKIYDAGYRKQEWISVDERLPETNEEVLVYSSVGKIYTACYIRVDGIEFWFENIDGFREITHWMPLPEAPKMKGEKNG